MIRAKDPKPTTKRRSTSTPSAQPSVPPAPRGRSGIDWAIAALGDLVTPALAAENLDLAQKCIAKIGDLNLALSRESRADERLKLQHARFEHSKSELTQLKDIEARIVEAEQHMAGVEQLQRQHSPTAGLRVVPATDDTTAPRR